MPVLSSLAMCLMLCLSYFFLQITYNNRFFWLELLFDCLLCPYVAFLLLSCSSLNAAIFCCRWPFPKWPFCKAAISVNRYLFEQQRTLVVPSELFKWAKLRTKVLYQIKYCHHPTESKSWMDLDFMETCMPVLTAGLPQLICQGCYAYIKLLCICKFTHSVYFCSVFSRHYMLICLVLLQQH